MGWWEIESSTSFVGDSSIEKTEEFIEALSRIYEVEFQRKPTLKELEENLRLVLKSSAEDLFSTLEGYSFEDINLKSKKIKKIKKVIPGDVIEIKVEGSKFCYIRLTRQLGVIKIFNAVFTKRKLIKDLKKINQIDYPNVISLDSVYESKWRIIGNIFTSDDKDSELKLFRINTFLACGRKEIDSFIDITSELKPMKISDLSHYPVYNVEHSEYFSKNLKKLLLESASTPVIE